MLAVWVNKILLYALPDKDTMSQLSAKLYVVSQCHLIFTSRLLKNGEIALCNAVENEMQKDECLNLKGPISYLFSNLYVSSQTPVVQP